VGASLIDNLILDIHEAVVLHDPLAAAGTARFQMSGTNADSEISNEVISCLAGAVGDEDVPAVAVCLFSTME
jgi:hypothetical protein